jgi:hypothetical protein
VNEPGRALIPKLALLCVGFGISLLLAEGVSRFVQPLQMARRVALDGSPVDDWLTPGAVYRQVSSEYDVLIKITDKGHRAPEPDPQPEVLFIGDSFTFGWGLEDDETFASLYCRALGRACANLGAPGTGTTLQIERLEHFISEWGWRPREVKLFIFAMTASFSAGNDLADNYMLPRWRAESSAKEAGDEAAAAAIAEEVDAGFGERLLEFRAVLEDHSNLLRVVKYHWGPLLKAMLVPDLDERRLAEALELTGAALARLQALSETHGFAYRIYLLHPLQDIVRGSHVETLKALNALSSAEIQPTAQLFGDDTEQFFFALDGHLNSRGARQVAEFLLTEDAGAARRR